jgi:hypothetical protein
MSATLKRLQRWYLSNCNDDWEHQYGLTLGTLDNPGWSIDIDLVGTPLSRRKLDPVEIQRKNENDWIHCSRTETQFQGRCGPNDLEELLGMFLDWAEEQ